MTGFVVQGSWVHFGPNMDTTTQCYFDTPKHGANGQTLRCRVVRDPFRPPDIRISIDVLVYARHRSGAVAKRKGTGFGANRHVPRICCKKRSPSLQWQAAGRSQRGKHESSCRSRTLTGSRVSPAVLCSHPQRPDSWFHRSFCPARKKICGCSGALPSSDPRIPGALDPFPFGLAGPPAIRKDNALLSSPSSSPPAVVLFPP